MTFFKAQLKQWAKELRNHFAAGMLVLLPIGISIWFIYIIAAWIDRPIRNLLNMLPKPYMSVDDNYIFGTGLLITLLLVLFTGVLTRFFLGRRLISLAESVVERVPILSRIYTAVKHVIHTILGRKKNIFEKVVMFEYPRKGIWTVGFMTSSEFKEPLASIKPNMISIFVPTVPNPTSGFFVFLPEEEVYALNLTVEEGLKIVVSAGAIGPPASLFQEKPWLMGGTTPPATMPVQERVPETTSVNAQSDQYQTR